VSGPFWSAPLGVDGRGALHAAVYGQIWPCRVSTGQRVCRHGRSVFFQMAEATVSRGRFRTILEAITTLRPLRPTRC
jgi:hypothetical protein